MYFGYRFPLTSHIRGNLLSCEMTLLRLSTDTQCVCKKKGKMDGSGQNLIDVHVPLYIFIISVLPIFYKDLDNDYWKYLENPIFDISREGSVDFETFGNHGM